MVYGIESYSRAVELSENLIEERHPCDYALGSFSIGLEG